MLTVGPFSAGGMQVYTLSCSTLAITGTGGGGGALDLESIALPAGLAAAREITRRLRSA
jgi:hypothetical protein